MVRPQILLLLALLAGPGSSAFGSGDFEFAHENVLGTSMELRVQASNEAVARAVESAVLAEIDRLAAIFSNHDATSEFRRWQAVEVGTPVMVSPELRDLFRASDHWRKVTDGAFDPRVHEFSNLWRSRSRLQELPTDAELAGIASRLKQPAWRLGGDDLVATRCSEAALTLDGIAKGEIIERACAAALELHPTIGGLLLNIGGDLQVAGPRSRTIAIARPGPGADSAEPLSVIEARDQAVATSGDMHRGYDIQGRWYSHIVDPRTGRPAERVVSATVAAARSATADALATAFNVLDPWRSIQIADAIPDVACMIVTRDGSMVKSHRWSALERGSVALNLMTTAPRAELLAQNQNQAKAKAKDAPLPPAPPGWWGNESEVVVDFEISRPDQARGRYRRPYVVVWVEDKDGKQIRTVLLYISFGGPGPSRWLPDLKRWWRTEDARLSVDSKDVIYTISQPTRPPGKYSVVWDGRDNHGKPVPAGEYLIGVEAAREHGTYQCIRKLVTIGDKPFSHEMPGGAEFAGARIEYHGKPAASSRQASP